MNFNKILIGGRLVQDAQQKQFNNGTPFVTFSIAYNSSRQLSNGEWQTTPYFFDVEYVGRFIDSAAKNRKGDIVLVEGPIVYQEKTYDDGRKQRFYVIKAEKILSIASKRDEQTNSCQQTNGSPPPQYPQTPCQQHNSGPQGYQPPSQGYSQAPPPQNYNQQQPPQSEQYYDQSQPAFSGSNQQRIPF